MRISFAAQVDLVDFSGPDYRGVDKRCVALRLVEKGLCDAALFSPSGETVLWSVDSPEEQKDYACRRQFSEKPNIIPGCPGAHLNNLFLSCVVQASLAAQQKATTEACCKH